MGLCGVPVLDDSRGGNVMRKTAGFQLVLLLAILAIITTTSGDETDSSHLAHLTAANGPQLDTSCDVCHVVPYTGVFIDSQDLANTTMQLRGQVSV